MQVHKWQAIDKIIAVLKIPLLFTGETGHYIRRKSCTGDAAGNGFKQVVIILPAVTPVHGFEDLIAAALQRDVEMAAHPGIMGGKIDYFRGYFQRFQRAQTNPVIPPGLRQNHLQEMKQIPVLEVYAVKTSVDTSQNYLPVAQGEKLFYLL